MLMLSSSRSHERHVVELKKMRLQTFFFAPPASESNLRLTAAADAFLTSSETFMRLRSKSKTANVAGVLSFGDFTLGVVRRRSHRSDRAATMEAANHRRFSEKCWLFLNMPHGSSYTGTFDFRSNLEQKNTALIWLLDASVSLSFSVTVRRTFPWWK